MTVGLGGGAWWLGPALEAVVKACLFPSMKAHTPEDPKQRNNSPEVMPAGEAGKVRKETETNQEATASSLRATDCAVEWEGAVTLGVHLLCSASQSGSTSVLPFHPPRRCGRKINKPQNTEVSGGNHFNFKCHRSKCRHTSATPALRRRRRQQGDWGSGQL